MARKTTQSVLRNVEETLRTAKHGLDDITSGDPSRRLGSLRNLVVFGRAVTNVLQNLKSIEPRFDDWYAPRAREMAEDDLLRFFYKLRSEILKEGTLPTSVHVKIAKFEVPRDLYRFGPPPANAKSFFIGDHTGGSGWEIQLEDGSIEKFYVDLPGDIGTSRIELPSAPDTHRGSAVTDKSIEVLARLYYDYIAELVREASVEFGRISTDAGDRPTPGKPAT